MGYYEISLREEPKKIEDKTMIKKAIMKEISTYKENLGLQKVFFPNGLGVSYFWDNMFGNFDVGVIQGNANKSRLIEHYFSGEEKSEITDYDSLQKFMSKIRDMSRTDIIREYNIIIPVQKKSLTKGIYRYIKHYTLRMIVLFMWEFKIKRA